MFIKRGYDRILAPVLAVGFLMFVSFNTTIQVRKDMPREFVAASSSWPAQKQAAENKIAAAYWDCVVKNIQWKYGYGYTLPQNPPDDFTVSVPGGTDPEVRARYWQKLRSVWYLSSTWEKTHDISFEWMSNPVESANHWLKTHVWKSVALP